MLIFYLCFLIFGSGAVDLPSTNNLPVAEVSVMWNEIQHLRTLLTQERNSRLSFEQAFLSHLNTFNDLSSRVNTCNTSQEESNSGLIATLERRVDILTNTSTKPMETGCESGTVMEWTHPIAPPWPVTKYITFDKPFERTPVITYGMTLLDSQYDTNVRAIIEAQNVTRHGFELILRKHANTRQWGLAASWMACSSHRS